MNGEVLRSAGRRQPLMFEEAYRSYTDRVNRYFYFRTHNREIAQDLAQQTFLQLFLASRKGTVESFSSSLVFTVAHNVFSNYIRTLRRHPLIPLENIEWVPNEDEDAMKRGVELGLLWKDIQTLPKGEEEILRLRYQSNLSIHAIAGKFHKSENAIKLVLSRVRKKLHQHFLALATLFPLCGVSYLWSPLP